MKQILNIFAKDARQRWPEVSASIALLVAFAWTEVRGWTNAGPTAYGLSAFFFSGMILQLVVPLVPISWMFLIVRAVHGESLVGDRQFWVTRPYDWRKLLAAKALFVLVFVNLPLLLLDIFLLAKAGFRPTSYFPGLLWMQLLMILLLFLPTFGLATVTAGMGQMLLALLFIALCSIGTDALSNLVPNSSFSAGTSSWSGLFLIATALAVILLQYSTRRTTRSRWLIVGMTAALTLLVVATPYRTLIAREYPPSVASPLKFALLPRHPTASRNIAHNRDIVPMHLPLLLTGLSKDSFLQVHGFIVTLTNSQGRHWDSGWQSQRAFLFADQPSENLYFNLDTSAFDQLKSSPVKLQVLLAFTRFRDKNQRPFVVPDGEFSLPELGFCRNKSEYVHQIACRVPLRQPRFLLVSSDLSASTCPVSAGETSARPGEIARGSIQNPDSSPAEIGISPIKLVDLYLFDWNADGLPTNPGICPGTPLILSDPVPISRNRIDLQFDDLSIADYRQEVGLGKIVIKSSR